MDDTTVASNRLGPVGRSGTQPVAPRLSVPWRTTAFDAWLEALFVNTVSTGTLTQGQSTKSWLTVEDRQPDAGSGYYALYQDVTPNQLTIRLQPNALVQAEFQCLGTLVTVSGTGTVSPTAAVTDAPFDTWTGSLTYGGSAFAVTSLEFTMDNRAEGRYSCFSRTPDRIVYNTDKVTGQLTCAFLGPARVNDALADTTNAMVVSLAYATKGHVWTFPKVHTTGWDAPVTTDPERLQQINFECEAVTGTKVSLAIDNT